MKKTVSFVLVVIAVTLVGYGVSRAAVNGPHADYRAGYTTGCTSGVNACHDVAQGTFLPHPYNRSASTDYTEFCLSCHNAAGEAHDKSAGSASKLPYVNLTGLDKSASYDGDSHSWNGVVGGAGTRTPTIQAFGAPSTDPTNHMPNGNEITCQVCHEGMEKVTTPIIQNILWYTGLNQGDDLNYVVNGFSNTEDYLAQYIRVYRSASQIPTAPTNTRTKKTYLVDPSEYTYDSSTATVTFNTAQTGMYIYIDITQPYFRVDNAANQICLDCHNDRQDLAVSHPGDPSVVDHHPVTVPYGYSGGLTDTLKASPDANIYIEGTDVLCTSCHDPHNAMSKDGMITRSADSDELCTDCHKVNGYDGYTAEYLANHNGSKHTVPTECLDCHTTHGTDNILLIKNRINGKAVSFRNFSGADSFGNDTGDGVCEACHTATTYHLASGGGTGHNTGKDCTECHVHANGFSVSGCNSCHGWPPPPAPENWIESPEDHASHMAHLDTAEFGNLVDGYACNQCHGNGAVTANDIRGDHNTTKDNAGMDTTTWASWTGVGGDWGVASFDIGSTIGKVSTADDNCTNVSCHSSAGTRYWGGGTDCNSCHSYPIAGSDWLAGNGHTVRYDGLVSHMPDTGYDETTDTYLAMTTDVTRCGKCHYNSLGDESNHKNGSVNVNANGNAACTGPDFTINVNTSRSDVTCSNVKCHTANKTTPNWW